MPRASRDERQLASGRLLVDEPANGVARLRIASPERRGALDEELMTSIALALDRVHACCVVLTGHGAVFSSGYDLAALPATDRQDGHDESFVQAAETLIAPPNNPAVAALDAFPFPTIALLNGHAIGGGLELALACDIRIASRDAELGMPPSRLGLVYSPSGIRRFLDVCGPAITSELFLSGRRIDADRAAVAGLVNLVVEPADVEATAIELASEIAANAPEALAGNKRIIRALQATGGELPTATERALLALRSASLRGREFHEGVSAFRGRRRPRWDVSQGAGRAGHR
jgi:enoyl-CoA hydratase/carnithine racemase